MADVPGPPPTRVDTVIEESRSLGGQSDSPVDINPFDQAYWTLATTFLTAERSQNEARFIASVLRLPPRARIVDLGCGIGRISNALASMGHAVVGVDRVASSLRAAADSAMTHDLPASYICADLRRPCFRDGEFDGAVSWYTSLAYGNGQEDLRILRHAVRALRRGGRLLIDHMNRQRALVRLPTLFEINAPQGKMIERSRVDTSGRGVVIEREMITAEGTERRRYRIRLYAPDELAALLTSIGLTAVTIQGRDGEPFTSQSERMVISAQHGDPP
jgi:SAM-dependent methyltransferase